MPAYCYCRITEISNKSLFSQYKSGLLNSIDKYEGRFIVLGQPLDAKEGTCDALYHFIIEFNLHQQAVDWFNSKEYASLNDLRSESIKTDVLIFKGL